ncbi:hypothetical protein Hypma_011204 [Hypsizygus marmoreus]|uniref:Uncharacterized protein n=1 Tax=Hypsizygus marmoreus TaxID=39966 RepID=A0A369JHD9_HYPMA|nr:hypothetical protein Hypma_011204 [Hypsizygus marmoreus]
MDYASPVVRAPSPASTIGTVYGEDETSFSDSEQALDHYAFAAKCTERIGLGLPRREEQLANMDPLLTRLPNGSPEERLLYEQVVASLRAAVRSLEENEIVEQKMLKSSQAPLEQPPSTTDIDSLMRSLMVAPGPQIWSGSSPMSQPR